MHGNIYLLQFTGRRFGTRRHDTPSDNERQFAIQQSYVLFTLHAMLQKRHSVTAPNQTRSTAAERMLTGAGPFAALERMAEDTKGVNVMGILQLNED